MKRDHKWLNATWTFCKWLFSNVNIDVTLNNEAAFCCFFMLSFSLRLEFLCVRFFTSVQLTWHFILTSWHQTTNWIFGLWDILEFLCAIKKNIEKLIFYFFKVTRGNVIRYFHTCLLTVVQHTRCTSILQSEKYLYV